MVPTLVTFAFTIAPIWSVTYTVATPSKSYLTTSRLNLSVLGLSLIVVMGIHHLFPSATTMWTSLAVNNHASQTSSRLGRKGSFRPSASFWPRADGRRAASARIGEALHDPARPRALTAPYASAPVLDVVRIRFIKSIFKSIFHFAASSLPRTFAAGSSREKGLPSRSTPGSSRPSRMMALRL
jgi:hypothetical protein